MAPLRRAHPLFNPMVVVSYTLLFVFRTGSGATTPIPLRHLDVLSPHTTNITEHVALPVHNSSAILAGLETAQLGITRILRTLNFPLVVVTYVVSCSSWHAWFRTLMKTNTGFLSKASRVAREPTPTSMSKASLVYMHNTTSSVAGISEGRRLMSLISSSVIVDHWWTVMTIICFVTMASFLLCMDATERRPDQATSRVPPSWGPQMESSYPYRTYCQDIQLWTMVSEMAPHQQCAAIVQRVNWFCT